jgi:hypothetical protein
MQQNSSDGRLHFDAASIHTFYRAGGCTAVVLGVLAVMHIATFGPPLVGGIGFVLVSVYSLTLTVVMLM